MDMRSTLTGFLLIALFGISLIAFGISFGQENNAPINIANDSRINTIYTGLNDTIYTYGDDSQGVYEEANQSMGSFNRQDPSVTGFVTDLLFDAVTGVGKSIMGVSNEIFGVVTTPLLKAIGIPRDARVLINTIIGAILLFTITLLAWQLYRQGK